MRKLLISALAAAVFSAVAFAQDENVQEESFKPKIKKSEIVLKLEISPSAQINTSGSLSSLSLPDPVSFDGAQYADNTGINVAAEYYYYFFNFLGVGGGFKQQFSRHVDRFGDVAISNLYVSIKPKLKLKPAEGSKCTEFVYLIAQGGFGFLNNDFEIQDVNKNAVPTKTESGLYYGAGLGFQLNNFIIECIFSVNEAKIKGDGDMAGNPVSGTLDASYASTNLNVGYRFGF